MMNKVKIAVAQMTSIANKEINFAHVQTLVQQSAKEQCKFLFLPENFALMATSPQEGTQAEPLDGPLFTKYCQLAKEHGMIFFLNYVRHVGFIWWLS